MQDTYRLRQWHMCMIPPSIIIGVGVGQNGSLTKCILKPTRKRESNCYFPSPDPGTSICCLDMILLLFDFLQFDLLNCAQSNPASQVWILFNTGEGILPSLPRGPKIKTTKTPVQKSTRCKLLDLQQSCQSNTEWAVIFKKVPHELWKALLSLPMPLTGSETQCPFVCSPRAQGKQGWPFCCFSHGFGSDLWFEGRSPSPISPAGENYLEIPIKSA